jgi:hypothetical protein
MFEMTITFLPWVETPAEKIQVRLRALQIVSGSAATLINPRRWV